jgi:hypothetical protein
VAVDKPKSKLFIKGAPGAILSQRKAPGVLSKIARARGITVTGVHYLKEDSPDAIGRASRPGCAHLANPVIAS